MQASIRIFGRADGRDSGITVIKLKQVEHVRNERKALAAVAGHPFITTLIASFSDEQSLYMLVCKPPRLVKKRPSHALSSAGPRRRRIFIGTLV